MGQPLEKFRQFGIEVTAWPTRNGGVSFSIRKSYKDKATGEYKESKTFFDRDLDVLAKLLADASQWAASQGDRAVDAAAEHRPGETVEADPDMDDLPF